MLALGAPRTTVAAPRTLDSPPMQSGRDRPSVEFTFRWFGPHDPVPLAHLAQVPGVRTVVTSLADVPAGTAWSDEAIAERRALCAAAGLTWTVAESVAVHESIKLGADAHAHPHARDDAIEAFALTLERLGRAGVEIVCYNFMPVFDWMRTEFARPLADGSTTMAHVQHDLDAIDLTLGLPQLAAWPKGYTAHELDELLERYAGVDERRLLEHYRHFIAAVAPVAERAGVRLAIHPDDPPWPIFGLPRIVNDEASLADILAASSSPAHGLTFCTGALGARGDTDVVALAERFASRSHFVHARNVRRTGERDFYEADHTPEAGDVNLVEVLRALLDGGFSGPLRPDHGRMIWGETGIPGYGLHDRALGLMYLRGAYDTLRRA